MSPPERNLKFVRLTANKVCTTPLTQEGFKWAIENLSISQLPSLLRSYIRDRIPSAFIDDPFLWEAIREWLATRLNTYPGNIGLNGSAQLGFSASPDKFGTAFDKTKSDLDFFVVDSELFEKLEKEVRKFCTMNIESATQSENVKVLSRTIQKGFFDTNKVISNHSDYPLIANINNLVSIIISKLNLEDFSLKRSSIRVFKCWNSYSNQMQINLNSLKSQLP